jgi:hypothetical protein
VDMVQVLPAKCRLYPQPHCNENQHLVSSCVCKRKENPLSKLY